MKIFINISILICLSISALAKSPYAGKKALIYNGPGACKECPEAVGALLEKNGFSIQYIKPGQLTKAQFSKADLYVQPGGTDDIDETLNALKPGELSHLQKFVSQGGRYLGICAGGYLAGRFSDEKRKKKAFALLPMDVVAQEKSESRAQIVPVLWEKQKRFLYFQSGPSFGMIPDPKAKVVATYVETGHIAAMVIGYGKGIVGVIGPHPEADEAWYAEDKLSTSQGLNLDLFDKFLANLF